MMAQDHRARAQFAPRRRDSRVHGVVRKYKIMIERATDAPLFLRSNCNRHFVPPSVPQLKLLGTEMLKASTGSSRSTTLTRPTYGVVEARSLTDIDDPQRSKGAQNKPQ